MDRYHRQVILANIDTLTEWTNYDKLKAGCIDIKILSIEDILEIEKNFNNRKSQHVQLLRKITETGPHSFNALVKICQLNFWDAADFLESFKEPDRTESIAFRSSRNLVELTAANVETDGNIFSSTARLRNNENIPLTPYTGPYDATFEVTRATQFSSQRNFLAYPMKSRNRGVLFLVNIIEIRNKPHQYRNGAMLDKMKLVTLFKEFGFEIFYYENLTLNEFRYLVDELIKSRHLRITNCLVFCVLSHGCFRDGHQMIQFSDDKNGSIEDVIKKFSNKNCPNLIRKPKLFIFPMCRGISTQIKVKTFNAPNADLQLDNVPAFSDIKICYGSVKGFEAFRDETVGSWYIQVFCEILASYAHCEHFDDLHKLIGQRLEYYCQLRSNENEYFIQTISSEDLGFTQHLFFNPGYFG